MEYTLTSCKGNKSIGGELYEVILAAREMDERLQPTGGVSIEDVERGLVCVVSDGAVSMCDAASIDGRAIQIDRSGQGHCWRYIDARDIPANIAEEIAILIDSEKYEPDVWVEYVGSNGAHYRY